MLLDGALRPKAWAVRSGQVVVLEREGDTHQSADSLLEQVVVVDSTQDFAAVFKPAGVHTQKLAASREPAVEQVLEQLFPQARPVLLNRLDQATSGLVLVGLALAAGDQYVQAQEQGLVLKTYVAAVQGRMTESLTLRHVLDTAKRKKVRVQGENDPDHLRWTEFTPLCPGKRRSLVKAQIKKGRRHQIRAHAAKAGWPLIGDALYGGPKAESLYLHHREIAFPGFSARCDPEWKEWSQCLSVV